MTYRCTTSPRAPGQAPMARAERVARAAAADTVALIDQAAAADNLATIIALAIQAGDAARQAMEGGWWWAFRSGPETAA